MQILKNFIIKIRVKHIIVLLGLGSLGIPLLNLIYGGIMNYSGYCSEKKRYLTFDDKIQIVFEVINNYDKTYFLIDNKPSGFKTLPYHSFEEYLKENPDCCSIIPIDDPTSPAEKLSLPPSNFLERITGDHSGEVIAINYRLNYFDRDGKLTFKNEKYFSVLTNCGNVRD
jgi:hypothetical protein